MLQMAVSKIEADLAHVQDLTRQDLIHHIPDQDHGLELRNHDLQCGLQPVAD